MSGWEGTSLGDRAGLRWPPGKEFGVAFSFDVDTYPRSVEPAIERRPGALSQALYEPGVGVPLLLEALAAAAPGGGALYPC